MEPKPKPDNQTYMIRNISLSPIIYQATQPFPYAKQDDILELSYAHALQQEILAIPAEAWDRYQNPFEAKFTLRDKWNFPPLLRGLFEQLDSTEFIQQLSAVSGYRLLPDPTRNFWGVHTYQSGDTLDIHVDAGRHPTTLQKKRVTLGIYLSANWKEEYGCELEIWKGTSAAENARLIEKVDAIAPLFNRLILFTCNDVAWHGNPEPVEGPPEAKRIFLTMSYLSENESEDKNQRTKAYFVARPNDPADEEKDKLRLLRADPEKYKEIYRV